jgi:ribosome maturation factor RimP
MIDETKLQGKLVTVAEDAISIEYTEGKNKKAVLITKEIPFNSIKQTIVLISF